MRSSIRAIIFDLDGTLVDSYPAILESVNVTRAAFHLPPVDLSSIKNMVGRGIENLMARAIGEEHKEEAIPIFRKSYDETHLHGTFLLPGVSETLDMLHKHAIRLAVATNKPSDYSRNILRHLQIDRFFAECFGPDRAGAAKPDPAMLKSLMRLLNSTPSETLYVGDMVLDAETARNAGVLLALVPTGGNTREELERTYPDYMLQSFSDLCTLIV